MSTRILTFLKYFLKNNSWTFFRDAKKEEEDPSQRVLTRQTAKPNLQKRNIVESNTIQNNEVTPAPKKSQIATRQTIKSTPRTRKLGGQNEHNEVDPNLNKTSVTTRSTLKGNLKRRQVDDLDESTQPKLRAVDQKKQE